MCVGGKLCKVHGDGDGKLEQGAREYSAVLEPSLTEADTFENLVLRSERV